MRYKTEIEGHSIEIRTNRTGSIDPWSLDYATENNIRLMITSDMGVFILIDGEDIYRTNSWGAKLSEKLINGEINTFQGVMEWLAENSEKEEKTLSEMIEILRRHEKGKNQAAK
jgi:hypothetical protein